MKCIKNKKTGDIQRVTDREAYNMVGSAWSYISKSEWKSVTRTPQKEESNETPTEPVERVKSKKQLRKQKVEA